jgi:hypothetical protein
MSLTSNYAAIAARKPKGRTKKKRVWRRPVKVSSKVAVVMLGVGNEHFKVSPEPSDVECSPIKIVGGGLPSLGKKR